MARVLCVCNAKGGVGKTTTAVNLGAYLATLGKRVLLVDFDPQANASSALGHRAGDHTRTIYHAIASQSDAEHVIRPSLIYNYHYIPSAPHLAGLLVELVGLDSREYYLRRFLNSVRHQYDYIIIDLPPSLSLLTINGLVASDEVLIPVQAEYYSLEGIGQLLETLDLIKNNFGHDIKIAGALLTMYDSREKLNRDVRRNLQQHFPHPVFQIEIPRSISLAEAPSFSLPVMMYRPDSPGALAYLRLAQELVRQEHALLSAPFAKYTTKNFGNFNL